MSALPGRPQFLVDTVPRPVGDGGIIGMPGPLGRRRLVSCLPFKDGSRRLRLDEVVVDQSLMYLGGPDGSVVGAPGLVVGRVIDAAPAIADTGFG